MAATEGAELPNIRISVDLDEMRQYSGEGNIHSSDEQARRRGLGRALVQGGQLTGYLVRLILEAFGSRALDSGEIAVTFLRPARANEPLVAGGKVLQAEGARIQCEIWIDNASGERVASGRATADAG